MGETTATEQIDPPGTCQHPGCGRPIRAVPFGWEHVDGRGGHLVELGAGYEAARRAQYEAVKAAAYARAKERADDR